MGRYGSYMEELGFVAFEKLKYKARFKITEISAIKQTSSPEQFKKYSAMMHWGRR